MKSEILKSEINKSDMRDPKIRDKKTGPTEPAVSLNTYIVINVTRA